ncbi:unnamed protein product [Mesocestoides corti]|uniref:Similar to n=1 Tax=Mesocestoides corti TaxID=53468 RepID=A0A0R3U105_MESCO|nr:unnamed protein product [Mesocestoides corti]
MEWSQLNVLLAVMSMAAGAVSNPIGLKNATIEDTGEVVAFEWYNASLPDKSQAKQFCASRRSSLPAARELRYFYKSLDIRNGSTFYLDDTIETTMDSPNEAIGERMCITIMNIPGKPLQLAETYAIRSCSIRADAVVCRRTTSTVESSYSNCVPQEYVEVKGNNTIEFNKARFAYVAGAICFALLLTNILWIILCYKYCAIRKQAHARIRDNTSVLFATSSLLKPTGFNSTMVDPGRYDLLPDVPLQQCDSFRKSCRSTSTRDHSANEETSRHDTIETIYHDNDLERKNTMTEATGFL